VNGTCKLWRDNCPREWYSRKWAFLGTILAAIVLLAVVGIAVLAFWYFTRDEIGVHHVRNDPKARVPPGDTMDERLVGLAEY